MTSHFAHFVVREALTGIVHFAHSFKMSTTVTFPQLKQALEDSLGRKLTINAMANEIEVPQGTLRRWFSNGIPPRAQRLVRMIIQTRKLVVVSNQDTTAIENTNETTS